jgi:hypothetical protein
MIIRILAFAFALASLVTLAGIDAGLPGNRSSEAALDCSDRHRFRVDIIDDDTGDPVGATGSRVNITPDPVDGTGGRDYVDNSSNDDSSVVGRIEEQQACEITGADPAPTSYTVSLEELPANCVLMTGETSTKTAVLTGNGGVNYTVECSIPTVEVIPDQIFLACGGRTDVTIRVMVDDNPPPEGTEIQVSTNFGSLSEQTTETDDDGEAEVEYRAPSTGGTAVIEARALSVVGQASVQVTCGTAGPASLGFPQATCSGNQSNVTFYWGSNRGGTQFLDLSVFDNDFAPGTFGNAGPLNPETESFVWSNLPSGVPHFWRVNTLTPSGWVTSFTGAFVPCGGPQIRFVTYACTGGGFAAVTFHWAPGTLSGPIYADLSVFNNGFAGDSFVNAGPMGHDWLNFTWSGILANVTHFWRVSKGFNNEWLRSATGQFTAFC